MTTRAGLLAYIRERLADATQWSDATLNVWINQAILDYSHYFPYVATKSYTFTSISHSFTISNLAPAPLRVLRVEYPDGMTPPRYLTPIPKTDPRFWGGAYYEVVGEPPTDIFLGEEAAVGEAVEVSYTAIHTLPTQDASVLTVPDIHLEALILFCLWKAAEEILMAEAINPDSLEFLVSQKGLNVIRLERIYRNKIWEFQQSSSSRVAGFWRMDGADRIY
jgi:hypothetical protein